MVIFWRCGWKFTSYVSKIYVHICRPLGRGKCTRLTLATTGFFVILCLLNTKLFLVKFSACCRRIFFVVRCRYLIVTFSWLLLLLNREDLVKFWANCATYLQVGRSRWSVVVKDCSRHEASNPLCSAVHTGSGWAPKGTFKSSLLMSTKKQYWLNMRRM